MLEMYSRTVWRPENLQSRCGQGWFLLKAQRENLPRPLFQLLRAPTILGIPWVADTSLQSLALAFPGVRLVCILWV